MAISVIDSLIIDPSQDSTPPPTLRKQVDDFGWNFVNAVKDFRHHVEGLFDQHCLGMERVEAEHKLEVAKLSAENAKLRGMLGLKASPELYQNIRLCTNPLEEAEKKTKNTTSKTKGSKRPATPDRAKVWDKELSVDKDASKKLRGRKDGDRRDQLGGCWEHFVAWVPAGASLSAPQPWEPIPTENLETPKAGKVQTSWVRGAGEEDDPEKKQEDGDESDEDPTKWKVLDVWMSSKEELRELRTAGEEYQKRSGSTRARQSFMAVSPKAMIQSLEGYVEDSDDSGGMKHVAWYMIHPSSILRMSWDVGSLLLVLYDMITIPLWLFDLPESFFVDFMEWFTRLFWTFDMGLSPLTGLVRQDGIVEMQLKVTAAQYCRTWLALDTLIVVSDWFEFFLSIGTSSGQSLAKLAKIFRVVRTVRLLRLARMKQVLKMITESIQSEKMFVAIDFAKVLFFLVFFAHAAACIWWGIGNRSVDDDAESWSRAYKYQDQAVESQYLMSLHWTLCMFAGGMEEIRPAAPIERCYAVILWIIAFMIAAFVTSVLTSSLVLLHIIGGTQARQVSNLRKYLSQNSISHNLSLRVQRSARHAISGDLCEDAVDLLPVVSTQLKLEMHYEMYSGLLRTHMFFEKCHREGPQVVRKLCHVATTISLLYVGDVIFTVGEAAAEPKMYFVLKGSLEYEFKAESTILYDKECIAEAALWVPWTHKGTLKAFSDVRTDVKVANLDAKLFQNIVDHFKDFLNPGLNAKVYAADFVNHLNSVDVVTDLTRLDNMPSWPTYDGTKKNSMSSMVKSPESPIARMTAALTSNQRTGK